MARVKLEKVSKIFDKDVVAVNEVDIDIRDKEFMVLVGPSGCGKSTTLRMVAGLEEISNGKIYIGDKVVNEIPPKDRDIAMVFQNYALYPHMTVFQNMAFGLKLRKYPKKEIESRVNEAAEILEIENLLNRKPKALSGGQRQRVAVGRAIVRKPKVFLFDEPLSNLDAKLRVQMRTEISKLHNRLETTMIYVTHDQMEAMTMGDRIVVMKDGFVQQIDSPLNLYNSPVNKFVAGFIGSPAMNFMTGTLRKNNGIIFDEGNIQLEIPDVYFKDLTGYIDKKIVLGIRPENIFSANFSSGVKFPGKVKSLLEVIEPMGNEYFLYLNTGINQYVARVNEHEQMNIGEKVDIVYKMEKVSFFDVETGKKI
ncbi:glycerol-3-phosphate ABC transporter ATP-binding protein [candidate division KSB1 bacterium 4572_119]|nr:MAG: glycerol-3-phosphate ABC transporter ATP-binding protein [candidate division KSB1 bacterium 4572_119]